MLSQGVTDAGESGGVCSHDPEAEPAGGASEVMVEELSVEGGAFVGLDRHSGWSFGMRVGPRHEDLGF